jgi:hypothetical protein
MRPLLAIFILTQILLSTQAADPVPDAKQPDATVREFFIAMAASDEARVRKVILPSLYMELLWKNVASSKEQLAGLEKSLASLQCRELKEGDSYDLPNGAKATITAELVEELKLAKSKIVAISLAGKEMPTALTVYDLDGTWRVDASTIIAARMAVKKLSEPKKKSETAK